MPRGQWHVVGLGLGLEAQVLGLGLCDQVLDLGLGLEAQVLGISFVLCVSVMSADVQLTFDRSTPEHRWKQ